MTRSAYEVMADVIGTDPGSVRDALLAAAPVAVGAVGALLWPGHRVLGALGGLALGRNAANLAAGSTTVQAALESLGAHAIATAGSLSLPGYPIIGYLAGAAAGGLVFTHEGKAARDRIRDVLVGVTGPAPTLDSVRAGQGVLRRGMSGPAVRAVQALLRDRVLMSKTEDDGVFDASDQEAVEDFQRQSGLAADGAVGKDTLAALEKGAAAPTASAPGKALQTLPAARPSASLALPIALGVGGAALVVTSIVLATRS